MGPSVLDIEHLGLVSSLVSNHLCDLSFLVTRLDGTIMVGSKQKGLIEQMNM